MEIQLEIRYNNDNELKRAATSLAKFVNDYPADEITFISKKQEDLKADIEEQIQENYVDRSFSKTGAVKLKLKGKEKDFSSALKSLENFTKTYTAAEIICINDMQNKKSVKNAINVFLNGYRASRGIKKGFTSLKNAIKRPF